MFRIKLTTLYIGKVSVDLVLYKIQVLVQIKTFITNPLQMIRCNKTNNILFGIYRNKINCIFFRNRHLITFPTASRSCVTQAIHSPPMTIFLFAIATAFGESMKGQFVGFRITYLT